MLCEEVPFVDTLGQRGTAGSASGEDILDCAPQFFDTRLL